MALYPLQIKPGINKEVPSLTSEPAWQDCNLVRFKNGYPEKFGGWQRTSHGLNAMNGIGRTIYKWQDTNGVYMTAIGTHTKLYIMYQDSLYDITPIRLTTTPGTIDFDTTTGSTTVNVNHTGHSADNGDFVTFASFTHADLVDDEVNTEHQITYVDADNYTIEVTTASTGTSSGVGTATTAEYQINIGSPSASYAYGYGSSGWNLETWGDERTTDPVLIALRVWSLDNFGDYLIATHESGKLYQWDYSMGFSARATQTSNAPTLNEIVITTAPDRHIVALGSTDDDINQDFMLVRWADQESLSDWTPTSINTAGDHILSNGTIIRAARSAQGINLIWTDSALISMQYIGQPFTFSFNTIGTNCGAISKNCVISKDNINFWMGDKHFYLYDGRVQQIPCTVHRYVFEDLNYIQQAKIIAGLNEEFNEIIWFYPSASSNEIDRYAIFNYIENLWSIGELERTAWYKSSRDQLPLACDSNGTLFEHEIGVDADGSAMTAYIESSDFDIDQGDKFYFIRRAIPDLDIPGGSVDFIFKTRRYPHSTQVTDTTLTCSATTEKLDTRIRTRQLAVRLESDAIGDSWRSGLHRVDLRPDGRR